MSTFDTYADSPFQIKREGQEIVVRQTRLSPTTIRVSWTVPNAISCELPAAYNGVIVTLDQNPTSLSKLPSDGSIYKADSTADANLHAGDKIGAALVVGAFYNDKITTYIDILDAPENKSFYVSVHAVDNVHRYHTDGVHSYSLPYGKDPELPTAAYQIVNIGTSGIFSTTPTNLNVLASYNFVLNVDGKDIPLTLSGVSAGTYADLVNEINSALIGTHSPTISETAPNLGTLWYNASTKTLKQYDGTTYNQLDSLIVSSTDPLLPVNGSYWFDSVNAKLNMWDGSAWIEQFVYTLGRDPRNPYCNDYWFNGTELFLWNGGAWVKTSYFADPTDPSLPPVMSCLDYWYHDDKLYQWDEKRCEWFEVPATISAPAAPTSGALWIDIPNNVAYKWDSVDNVWVTIIATFSDIDPSLAVSVSQRYVWIDTINDKFYFRDGTSWTEFTPLGGTVKPQAIANGAIWFNSTNKTWYKLTMGNWVAFAVQLYPYAPNIPTDGTYWFDTSTSTLNENVAAVWLSRTFSATAVYPTTGAYWYKSSTKTLSVWSGAKWNTVLPIARVEINSKGNIQFYSNITGSQSWICISDVGNLWTSLSLSPIPQLQDPVKGTDPVSTVPSYKQLGVGTDGSQDERRELITRIKGTLGYPVMEVELTKEQMDIAIDMALEKLRQSSSAGYKRAYFVLDLLPRQQHYKLTDETVGFHRIVDIFYLYRQTSTFMGTVAGNDVYGQMMIQNLFNMGKFDLLSYHMVSQYVETMQQVFASEIQFVWNEYNRTLSIMKDFPKKERVLVDAMVERTEQDLFTDRDTRPWIQKYATAQARYMLAEIRGKFSTLPGAGGNVSLNAGDLRTKADQEVLECLDEIDNFIVNNKNDFGLATDFVLG